MTVIGYSMDVFFSKIARKFVFFFTLKIISQRNNNITIVLNRFRVVESRVRSRRTVTTDERKICSSDNTSYSRPGRGVLITIILVPQAHSCYKKTVYIVFLFYASCTVPFTPHQASVKLVVPRPRLSRSPACA